MADLAKKYKKLKARYAAAKAEIESLKQKAAPAPAPKPAPEPEPVKEPVVAKVAKVARRMGRPRKVQPTE